MHQGRRGLALELLRVEAQHGAEGAVAMQIATLTIDEGDADGRVLDRIAEQRLQLPGVALQHSFGLFLGKASLSAAHRIRSRPSITADLTVRSGGGACRGLRHMDASRRSPHDVECDLPLTRLRRGFPG